MRSPSGKHQSGTRGFEPVDTSAQSNPSSCVPSAVSTVNVFGPVKRATPRISSTPWLSSSVVVAFWRCDLMPSMREIRPSTSTSGCVGSRPMPSMRREKLIAPPVAIIVFDGMQSHRCAAPPMTSRSIIVTLAPSRAA